MAVYSENLQLIQGRVRQVKPNAAPGTIRDCINDRIRSIIDSEIFWADLMAMAVLSMPQSYGVGTISFSTGSVTVPGSGTAWPVNDVSNATIPLGVRVPGVQQVTPSSMVGIVPDSFLYVDAGGTPEAVSVISVTTTTFTASFGQVHNPNCTITQSSLAGLQLKTGAYNPIYTVRAIHSATELEINLPWGGGSISGLGYQILKIYFTIDPALKDILNVWDPIQGRPLLFHKSQDYLNLRDTQRQATGYPLCLADYLPTESGSMQYELWPHQVIAYQIPVLFCKQWPALRNQNDRPPWFINPGVIIDGATADCLRIRNQQGDQPDPFFDPKLAGTYDQKFIVGLNLAKAANQSKILTSLEPYRQWFSAGPGGSYNQSHLDESYWD